MPKNDSNYDDNDDENGHNNNNNTIGGHDDIDNNRNAKRQRTRCQVHPTDVTAMKNYEYKKKNNKKNNTIVAEKVRSPHCCVMADAHIMMVSESCNDFCLKPLCIYHSCNIAHNLALFHRSALKIKVSIFFVRGRILFLR